MEVGFRFEMLLFLPLVLPLLSFPDIGFCSQVGVVNLTEIYLLYLNLTILKNV